MATRSFQFEVPAALTPLSSSCPSNFLTYETPFNKEGRERRVAEEETETDSMRLLVPAAACAALFFVTFGVPASVQAVSCPNDECIVTDVIEEYPFIVSLSGDTACTGTVVGGCDGCETGWILTAAHCVYDDEAGGGVDENIEITVAFAPETRYSDAPSEVTLTYDDVFMNDNFRTSGNEEDDWNDDIALLRFDPACESPPPLFLPSSPSESLTLSFTRRRGLEPSRLGRSRVGRIGAVGLLRRGSPSDGVWDHRERRG